MRVRALGEAPTPSADSRAASRKLEVAGVLLGGAATVTGALLLATGREREGYALVAATAIVGTIVTAVRLSSEP